MKIANILGLSVILVTMQIAHADGPECESVTPSPQEAGCRYAVPGGAWEEPRQAEWSRDIKGNRSGFVNIYAHGNLEDLNAAFVTAGWTLSLDQNRKNDMNYVRAAVRYQIHLAHVGEKKRLRKLLKRQEENGEDFSKTKAQLKENQNEDEITDKLKLMAGIVQAMPVSNETVCGKVQVAAFESENSPLGGRHHLRVFATGRKDGAGQDVWAIVANQDTGIMFDPHRPNQLFFNHRVEPNSDLERDKVLDDLKSRKVIEDEPAFVKLAFTCSPPPDKAFSRDGSAAEIQIRK